MDLKQTVIGVLKSVNFDELGTLKRHITQARAVKVLIDALAGTKGVAPGVIKIAGQPVYVTCYQHLDKGYTEWSRTWSKKRGPPPELEEMVRTLVRESPEKILALGREKDGNVVYVSELKRPNPDGCFTREPGSRTEGKLGNISWRTSKQPDGALNVRFYLPITCVTQVR